MTRMPGARGGTRRRRNRGRPEEGRSGDERRHEKGRRAPVGRSRRQRERPPIRPRRCGRRGGRVEEARELVEEADVEEGIAARAVAEAEERHYQVEVNKGGLSVSALTKTLNDRWDSGWRLSHVFEQRANTVLVFASAPAAGREKHVARTGAPERRELSGRRRARLGWSPWLVALLAVIALIAAFAIARATYSGDVCWAEYNERLGQPWVEADNGRVFGTTEEAGCGGATPREPEVSEVFSRAYGPAKALAESLSLERWAAAGASSTATRPLAQAMAYTNRGRT